MQTPRVWSWSIASVRSMPKPFAPPSIHPTVGADCLAPTRRRRTAPETIILKGGGAIMTIKLHVFPLSPRAFKVMWCANHLGIAFEPVLVDFAKGGNRTPEFVGMNPNMRMPVLEDGDFCLWESNVILQYLASLKPEAGLLTEDTKERLQIVKWQFWDSAHWAPACAIFAFENYVKKLFGRGEPSESEIARGN